MFNPRELGEHGYNPDTSGSNSVFTSIRGEVFDLTDFAPHHLPDIVPQKSILAYGGKDATPLFPIQISALCVGINGPGTIDDSIAFQYIPPNSSTPIDKNFQYHDFRAFRNDSRPDWYWEQMTLLRSLYKKGDMAYPKSLLVTMATQQKRYVAVIDGNVYDLSPYFNELHQPDREDGKPVPKVDTQFMDPGVTQLFTMLSGQDVTKNWNALKLDTEARTRMRVCLKNLFYIGKLDTRSSPQCVFSEYILLAISLLLCSVIGFKFLAALQFSSKNLPENLDKFIMCQIPAYTEDEESLRRAIDSLARMKYDDKRKLLVVVCDGMIIGQGNDKPTPRIVLDILQWSGNEPETLSFESLGEGQKQHNMGKVYSGLYDTLGHIVPFLVIVKVGKPSEVSRSVA